MFHELVMHCSILQGSYCYLPPRTDPDVDIGCYGKQNVSECSRQTVLCSTDERPLWCSAELRLYAHRHHSRYQQSVWSYLICSGTTTTTTPI